MVMPFVIPPRGPMVTIRVTVVMPFVIPPRGPMVTIGVTVVILVIPPRGPTVIVRVTVVTPPLIPPRGPTVTVAIIPTKRIRASNDISMLVEDVYVTKKVSEVKRVEERIKGRR